MLLTGRPGIGKTTVVVRTVGALREAGTVVGGFFTEEVRGHDGRRAGFDIVRLDGRRVRLARVGLDSDVTVGSYGVDVDAVARHAIPALDDPEAEVVVVDEIAPMELACPGFSDAVTELLERPVAVLATVHRRGDAFTDSLKGRDDVEVIEVTPATRDALPERLTRSLGSW
jgi:nucleoside-triphosphatase